VNHTSREIATEALRLPEEERLALAAELIDSVEGREDPEWDKAWLDELNRRRATGTDNARPWAEVRARVLKRLSGT
jgi:hypothetical protein